MYPPWMKFYFTKKYYLIDLSISSRYRIIIIHSVARPGIVTKASMIFIFTEIQIINVYLNICINDSNIHLSKYNTIGK